MTATGNIAGMAEVAARFTGDAKQCGWGSRPALSVMLALWYFLKFRLEVVTARLEHELGALQKRIHILEGFETIFDALDEILKIVRKSDGKADAAAKVMARFSLDAEQTDAILELKIYRLARLEILVIQQELAEKRAEPSARGGVIASRDIDSIGWSAAARSPSARSS